MIKSKFTSDLRNTIAELTTDQNNSETVQDKIYQKVLKFLNGEPVRQEVTKDFNERKYYLFTPAFGDMSCQTRPLLLIPIIKKKNSFEQLDTEDQYYLTLCHVLRNYNKDIRDTFGLLFKEIKSPVNIKYQKTATSIFKIPRPNKEVIKALSSVMGKLSVEVARHAASLLKESEDLLVELNTGIRNKDGYQVEPTAPEFFALLKNALRENIFLLIKVTRLKCDIVEDEVKYSCQGGAVIMYIPQDDGQRFRLATANEQEQYKLSPSIVVEGYSILVKKKQKFLEQFKLLSACEDFESYLDTLKSTDIFDLLMNLAVFDDAKKHLVYKTKFFAHQMEEVSEFIERDYSYIVPRKPWKAEGKIIWPYGDIFRSKEDIPFGIAHLYVSTSDRESLTLRDLPSPNRQESNKCNEYQAEASYASDIIGMQYLD